MSGWHLEAIHPGDISDILKIERDAFNTPWSRDALAIELSCKGALNYVVRDSRLRDRNAVIGYGFFRLNPPELHILKIAVVPANRNDGVASWLLKNCFEESLQKGADCAYLEVRPSNRVAIKLYEKLGFQIIGRRPHYYPETREDALVMMKNLKEEA